VKSRILIRRQHDLRPEEARRRVADLARDLQRRYGGNVDWDGATMRFKRSGASGRIEVSDRAVEVVVDVGLLLRPLSSRIEREIRTVLDEHLGAPSV
jgi:putative polyhydroxyalkanoate system protein